MADTRASEKELIEEIRDRYRYLSDCWREARDERKTDLRYVAGDPWDPADKKARADAGRPAINHDELNQYLNATINSLRQAPRGIKIEPAGGGASDKSAELRQSLVRTIENRSHAPSIYLTAYQHMCEGGYGFFRISRRYKRKSFKQELWVAPIGNPDSVLYDFDAKEPDWSDAQDCFILDPLRKSEFLRRWPKAEVRDFGYEEMRIAREWIQDNIILTAEYWRLEPQPATLYELEDGTETYDRPKNEKRIRRQREDEQKKLVQYWTNGIEILERNEEPGETLPIIPMIGLQRYMDDGKGATRKIFSMVRLARDPQMSHAYLCSQQMEEAGLTPKTPYKGYVGQFETDKEAWDSITKIPRGYVQVDPVVDGATGQILPLPEREQFTPNFQAYEVAKDSTRRAIQAAMGINPLPTAAQRANQKSGVALEKIEDQMQVGSFHFVDSFDRALELGGRVLDSYLPIVYDTDRDEALRDPDGTAKVVRLNAEDPETGEANIISADEEHDITVSTGPSAQSQRQAQEQFLEQLVSNIDTLPVAPPQRAQLLSLAIRMRNLGPLGDEMAEIVSPSQGDGQAQQQLALMQQQAAAAQQQMAEMMQELQQLRLEKQGKIIDNQFKIQLERMREENQLAIAEINTKAQRLSERMETFADMMQQFHSQAHDVGLQAAEQEHERGMAQQQAAQAQQAQGQQQAHEQQMAAQQAEQQQQLPKAA